MSEPTTPTPTMDRLGAIVASTVGLGPVAHLNEATPMADLSMDSVVVLELLLAAETEFKVEIDAQELIQTGAFRTLGTLAGYIDAKLRSRG